MPFHVIIIGAGLGGLCAAFCLARDGHTVTLCERRPKFEPRGGGILIRPNASRFLRQWGLEDDMEAISDRAGATDFRNGETGELLMKRQAMTASALGNPDWGTLRRDMQILLHRKALEAGAKIEFGVMVQGIHESGGQAFVQLSSRQNVKADLVLVADGVTSRLRAKVIGHAPQPNLGWSTIYQTMVDGKNVRADPDARRLMESPDLNVWMVPEGGAYVVDRGNMKLDRYSGVYGVPETDSNPRLYDEHGDIDFVRKQFEKFHPAIRASLRLAKSCDRWRLTEMHDLPEWVSKGGRLVLLGDSAHSMLPSAAQGFSQIIEDVAALSYLLKEQQSLGFPRITQVWQEVRIPRVNKIKAWAHNNEQMYTKGMASSPRPARQASPEKMELNHVKANRDAPFRTSAFIRWVFGYDAVGEVKKHLGLDVGGESQAKL